MDIQKLLNSKFPFLWVLLLKNFIFSPSSPFLCNFPGKIIERVADLSHPQLDPAVKEAFDVAYDNIYAFHFAPKAPLRKLKT
ncbi:hypothetical protein C5167_040051 [Papaver somniferum]|uniref:Uncharacterized protein n=1 Tax=Papaver somniferum TaxID=3469 RepID=A0A4Y7IE30_PAPSO|nr:hypothetical protein C5167_040051 [Papaver somniferum]